MWRRLMTITAGLTIVGAACTTAVGNTGRQAPRDLEVLWLPEMTTAGARDAYEAVTRLRPLFIKNRGPASLVLIEESKQSVYLDNVRLGGIDVLHTIPVESIRSIQYLSAAEATYRWGAHHAGGVILLSTH